MEFIDSQYRCDTLLHSLINDARVEQFYLDLEADNFHHYEEVLCTVQLHANGQYFLLDASVLDLKTEFSKLLKNSVLWMHGSDYDQYLFTRFVGFPAAKLYDTQIAAQLCGFTRFGYGALVQQLSGKVLPKDSQRADWTLRPLPEKMIEYAKNDVRFLPQIADILSSRLEKLERWSWFEESCERLTESAIAKKQANRERWRINGSGSLQSSALRYLKALWEWRDDEARQSDKPSFKIVNNQHLLEWAKDLGAGNTLHFPQKMRASRRNALNSSIELASELPESDWPEREQRQKRHKVKLDEEALSQLISTRDLVAKEYHLAPGVIASRKVLESIVRDASEVSQLMNWQRALMHL